MPRKVTKKVIEEPTQKTEQEIEQIAIQNLDNELDALAQLKGLIDGCLFIGGIFKNSETVVQQHNSYNLLKTALIDKEKSLIRLENK